MNKILNRKISMFLAFIMLISSIFVGIPNIVRAEEEVFVETFDNATIGASYVNGKFIGVNGIEWNYVHSRNEENYSIDGKGIMLRRPDEPSTIFATIDGGIKDFSVDLLKAFTGGAERAIGLYINEELIKTFPMLNSTDIQSFEVKGINVEGEFKLELRNISPKMGNAQITIDNITWTSFSSGSTEPPIKKVAKVTADPTPGAVEEGTIVTLSSTTEGAGISYTTDGSEPTVTDVVYGKPTIKIIEPLTIKAIAVKSGMDNSDIATFDYTIKEAVAIISAKEAKAKPKGTEVRVKGIATYSTQSRTLFMQDDTGGICIDLSGANLASYVGKEIDVIGTTNEYGGMVQVVPKNINNIIITNNSPDKPHPEIITIEELMDTKREHEGKLIKIENAKISVIGTSTSALFNHTIIQNDVETTLRAGALTGRNVGDYITITGVAGYFNSPQIQSNVIDIIDGIAPLAEKVIASPASGGTLPIDGNVILSTTTEGATITYTINNGEEITTEENSVTVTIKEFNQENNQAIIKAKASKDGYTTAQSTFFYTQAKTKMVTSTPVGAVDGNSQVTLTAADGATIKYIVTIKAGTSEETYNNEEIVYTEPITLKEEDFPIKITAYAIEDKYLNSDLATFNYYLKSNKPYKNYFGQLHSHTTNSDGAGTLEEAFTWARDKAKLDFFAVTDHSNSFDTASKDDKAGTYNLGAYNKDNPKWKAGKEAAAAAAVPDKYVSVYGYEMTWSGGPGHINTFATEGFVSRNNTELNNKTNDAGMRAYYELLKLHPESISQFNHPGTTFGNFSGFAYYDPIIDQRISLIEVGNGEGAIGSGGYFPSYEQYDMALDKGWHVAPTNNQDNHKAMWGNSNTARTVVYTNDFTTEGIYQAMRDMRVYATEDANLDIVYTLNDEQLGTILNTVPATATFKVDAKNVAGTSKIRSISIITNGGVEAHKQTYGTAEATFDYIMNAPKAGYYYIKVVQEDGRIAVTAPIWLGKAEAVGISEVNTSVPSPVTTEEMAFTTTVFNNESTAVTLNSIRYQIKGGDIIGDNILNTPVQPSSNTIHTQRFTPIEAKRITIIITVSMTVNGTIKTFTREIVLNVQDIEKLNFIGIDASHLNEYVAGNYKDSMGNFSEIAMKYGLRTVMLRTSEEFIAATANPKYQMFVITAPTRRLDPATGITHKSYSQTELDAIDNFAKQGKTIIITGWGDFYESYSYVDKDLEHHMAGQQNKLLSAIGATLRLADDEADDNINCPIADKDGRHVRLYLDDYNEMVSPLLEGILEGQKFSHYGGSTVYAINPDGTPAFTLPDSVIPIISGYSTTSSKDRDGDGYGFEDITIKIPRYGNSPDAGYGTGKVLLTASETLNHSNGITSQVIVSGGAFMSNFEIKNSALDNPADAYSNENILRNLLSTIENITITPIADVKTAAEGTEFTIEGIATVSVYDGTSENNTGFFDSIYVQDDTGGINLFPVANGVQAGQRIRVTGMISSYQGERQLAVTDISIIDSAITPVTPKTVSTKDAMSSINTGRLIKTTGTVTHIVAEPTGVINQITIDDGSGAAIVYINAYITPGKNLSFVTEGAVISVTGLGSIGENFTSMTDFLPRIRVRDRGEIEFVSVAKYTVKFDTDGGSAVADVTDIVPNTTIILPAAPTKEGFTFNGWFTGRNGTGIAFTSNTIINTNITVYAKWIKNTSESGGGGGSYNRHDENQATKPPVISPPTSSVVDSKIEVVLKSNDNGVYKVTISAKDVNAIIQQTVGAHTVIQIEAIAPVGAQSVSMSIPASAFQAIAGTNGASVAINTGIVSVTFDEKAVDAISKVESAGDVEISVNIVETTTLSKGALDIVGTHPVYDFSIIANGKKVHDLDDGKAFVKIPYTLKPGEDADSVVLFHVNSDGELEYVRSVYNTQTKCVEAVLNDLSVYAVAHNKVTFKDVSDTAWYSKAIGFIASRGITSGVDNENFAPLEKLTREQFLVMLMRAYNIAPDSKASDNFDDVDNNYAAAYISAARRLGISNGIGGNKFGPEKEISRQEMFSMLYNSLKVIDELPTTKGNLSIDGYSDLEDVAEWALPAMTLMVESGLSIGTGNNKLSPMSTCSRADMAQILYNILK